MLVLNREELLNRWIDSKESFDEERAAKSGLIFEQSETVLEKAGICFDALNGGKGGEILENPYFHEDLGVVLCCALLLNEEISITHIVEMLIKQRCKDVILQIVRNCPDRLDLIIETLVSYRKPSPLIGQILHQISEQGLWCALKVREELMEAQILSDLVLHLTVHNIRDGLEFCSASLHMECSWLRDHFAEYQEKEGTPAAKMRGLVLHATEFQDIKQNGLGHLLHLYSGLCGMWGLRLSQGSSQRIMNCIINGLKEQSPIGEQALCFLLVCEGLAKLAPPDLLRQCILSLYNSEIKSVVFLVAVRFATKGLALNANWAKTVARLPVSIHGDSLQTMGSVFREIFNDQMLVKNARTMLPVIGLNGKMTNMEDANVLSMKEMMSSHLLLRTCVNPEGWMANQLSELQLPLHPTICDLIGDFVWCCCAPAAFCLTPLTTDEIKSLQSHERLVVRLCVAYVVLTHNSMVKRMNAKKAQYPREVVEGLSLKRLLVSTSSNPLLRSLSSKVMGLCFFEHPEIMVAEIFPGNEDIIATWIVAKEDSRLSVLSTMTEESLCAEDVRMELFQDILPSLLNKESNDAQIVFCRIWNKLHRLMPIEVAIATLKCFKGEKMTCSQLISDPILILKVNEIVYEIPPFFGLVLEILSVYAVASRKRLSSAVSLPNVGEVEREGMEKLMVVQDCLISQLVIEICNNGTIAIQDLCCSFLHQQWIQNPRTMELLHHQGYPLKAVSMLVEKVPSMHVCIDFLPALIQSNSSSRRIWAVYIASFLLKKYATPRALEISRMIIHSFVEEVRTNQNKNLLACLDSLKRILKAFPVLLDDMIELCEFCDENRETVWNGLTQDVFDLK